LLTICICTVVVYLLKDANVLFKLMISGIILFLFIAYFLKVKDEIAKIVV